MTELMWRQSVWRFGICVLLAGVLWFMPIPEDLPVKGWHVFAVFIAVIVSFILRPYPENGRTWWRTIRHGRRLCKPLSAKADSFHGLRLRSLPLR